MGWHHENMKYINYETDCACRDENESDKREGRKFYNVLLNVHVFGLRPQIKKREYFERTLWGNHLENFSCRFKSAAEIKKRLFHVLSNCVCFHCFNIRWISVAARNLFPKSPDGFFYQAKFMCRVKLLFLFILERSGFSFGHISISINASPITYLTWASINYVVMASA